MNTIPTQRPLGEALLWSDWEMWLEAVRDGRYVRSAAHVFGWLTNHHGRMLYCLAMQERYRRLIQMGRQNYGDAIVRSKERRYKFMTEAERRAYGEIQWFKSLPYTDLEAEEKKFARWAVMYGATR